MYKLFLLLSICSSLDLAAQIQRGDRLFSLTSSFPATQFDRAWSVPQPAYGANLQFDEAASATSLTLGGDYGYALWDRLMLGVGIMGRQNFGKTFSGGYLIQPRVRYYVVNTAALMVFGQVGSSVVRSYSETPHLGNLQLTAGVHYPLTSSLLLSPQVAYLIDDGDNAFALDLSLQLRLGRGETEDVQAGIQSGRVMVGAQSARIALREGATTAGAQLGAHYFLTDRLAVGGQLGYGGDYVDIMVGVGNTAVLKLVQWDVAAAARYYLSATGRLAWFAEAGTGLKRSSVASDILVNVDAESRGYYFLGGGLQYFTSERFSLEAAPAVRYHSDRGEWLYGLNLGVRYVL